jgi:hypothetical protein
MVFHEYWAEDMVATDAFRVPDDCGSDSQVYSSKIPRDIKTLKVCLSAECMAITYRYFHFGHQLRATTGYWPFFSIYVLRLPTDVLPRETSAAGDRR